ncbi:MAG: outer membrane protein assembly factor BamE [Pseudomonadota bacterium]
MVADIGARRGRTVAGVLLVSLAIALLAACDGQRIQALEEGVSTEADVRRQFGEPERIWPGPGGSQVFEYDRQPSGQRNYMIAIGPDGKMAALRQVLTPENFQRIVPGMPADEVRQRLGRPARVTPYALKNEIVWDWRYLQPPVNAMVFSVTFGPDSKVLRTGSMIDPESEGERAKPAG